jgi:hypothetical protein
LSIATIFSVCRLGFFCSTSFEITSPFERFEKGLMRLTEVALVTECCFVDSSGGVC